MTSEFNISFSGAGGHSHDGISSSRINTTSYSIFDFRTGVIGNDQSRIALQQTNKISFDNYIVNLLNTREFSPTLLKIKPNSITGKILIEGTVIAAKLETNMVLVKQQIQSNNFNGVIDKDNVITNNGTAGWAISSSGQAVFNNVTTRGSLVSDNGSRGTIITDGYIKGLYSAGVEFRGYTGTDYSYINGGVINTESILISDGTDEFNINPVNEHVADVTVFSNTASDSGIRVQRSGSTNQSRHMTFAKTDGTKVGAIRYKNNDNNTMVFEGDITGTSDIRLKENVESLSNSLSIIKEINPVKFNFIRSPDVLENGFIAQELYDVYPMAVEEGGDNPQEQPWGVIMPRLIPIIVGAIKEISAKVDDLEARLQALEGV
jgi:hypothetical protein